MKCLNSSRLFKIHKKQVAELMNFLELGSSSGQRSIDVGMLRPLSCGNILRKVVKKGWDQVGNKLGTSWEEMSGKKVGEKVGKKKGEGWEKDGKRLGKSWEKVGTSWGAVENRAKLGTSWETLGKELGNGCEQVEMRIIMLQRLSDMRGKAAAE